MIIIWFPLSDSCNRIIRKPNPFENLRMCHGIHGKPPGQSSEPYHIDLMDKSQIDKWLSVLTKEDLAEYGKHCYDQDSAQNPSEHLENQSHAGRWSQSDQLLSDICIVFLIF